MASSTYIGSSTKYYLTKVSNDVERACQIDEYTGGVGWTDRLDRATQYDDLEHVKNLKNIQQMMSTFMGKDDTFYILKHVEEVTAVTE